MDPTPNASRAAIRTEPGRPAVAFRCPACEGDLAQTDGSWACGGCDYVPRHGAD